MRLRGCPQDEVVARLSEGHATAQERREIEQHIDDCAACRVWIAALLGRSSRAATRSGSAEQGRDAEVVVEPGDHIGRYPILGLLGTGAMGAVYLAHDPELDRKVAIKVLRPRRSAARVRLRDEARLLAKLSHPNVVAVYEVGEVCSLDFVVMEHVDGANVGEWLRAAPRSWRDVLEVFVAAGRGIAAAHRAQLVHRDIKPTNLLIGSDCRVRVGDFGLALAAGDPALQRAAIAGTPAYMAPELRAGAPADALSDQYAFCVALHEGLFVERPRREPAAYQRGVPSRIRRAVLRGLRPDPAERFPTMDALLAALALRTPRWQRIAAAAIALLFAGGIGWQIASGGLAPIDRCEGSAQLAGAWDVPRRAAVRVAFAATARGYAPDAFSRLAHQLDNYSAQWRAGYRDACEATHVRGEQSEALLDQRMQCLRWRRDELAQLTHLLATELDDDVMARAISASQALTAITGCADLRQLTALVPLPSDPVRTREIEAVDRELAAVVAQARAGKYIEGLAASTQLLPRVRRAGYSPVLARALQQHAELEAAAGDDTAAETTLREAATVAASAGDTARLAAIWTTLLEVVGVKQSKPDAAWAALGYVETAVALAGSAPALRAKLLNTKADVLERRGDYQRSSEAHREALAIQREHGDGPIAVLGTHDGLCRSLRMAGEWRAADVHCLEAVQLSEQTFGPDHPQRGIAMTNRASLLGERGELVHALDILTRTLDLYHRAYPPEHPRITIILNNIGTTLERQERYREALPYARRVLEHRERRPADAARLATALSNLGAIEEHLGDHAAAAVHFGRALVLQEAALHPEHDAIVLTLVGLGEVAVAAGDQPAARGYFERALALGEKSLGATHPVLAHPLELLATQATGRGDHRTAVALLERAAGLPELQPTVRGYMHLELAEALWREGRDRRRARTMAEAALAELPADKTAEVTAWLRSHR